MSETTKHAVVNVAPRLGFSGFFSAGEFWAHGTTPVEVVADVKAKLSAQLVARKSGEDRRFITEAQLAELQAEHQVLSVLSPEQAAAQVATGAVVLNEEERALVEEHRKKKAAEAPKAHEKKPAEAPKK